MNISKKCNFLPEKCIFLTKLAILPPGQHGTALASRNIFSIGIFLLKFQRIFWGKVGHMVKTPSEHFQFSQKWAIFERFEKKSVQK